MPWDDNLTIDSAAYKLASCNDPVIRSLAGPGSGKSFGIKKRITRLLEEGIDPQTIFAITFTRTSAADLKKEISSIKVPGADKVIARTVHAHAMAILGKQEVKDYTKRNPRMIIEHEIEPAIRDIDFPDGSGVKERWALLQSYLAAWATLQSENPAIPRNDIELEFEKRIVDWLTHHNGVMVGEVIHLALRYLIENPASTEIGKFSHLLVDEYQDLNKSEQEFIHVIRGQSNILIVGDDDQSIYSFKNAHPEGIKEIDTLYGSHTDIPFDTIRRCPKKVTQMASELISKNTNRSLGKLTPYEANQDGIVEIIQWGDDKKELEGIISKIKDELQKGQVKPGDILVLAPRRLIGYKLRDRLLVEQIPVKSYFRESVIKNSEVRKAYSLLHLLSAPQDKISLRYLIGAGSADFRRNQYKKLSEEATARNVSVRDVLDSLLSGSLSLTGLTTVIEEYRKILAELTALRGRLQNDPETLFEHFIKNDDQEVDFYELKSIYQSLIATTPKPETTDLDDIQDWFASIMSSLTEKIALPDSPEEIDHVRIMSLHASKGLSAKFVILMSMIDELIPFIPEGSDAQTTKRLIEEQRRLFYVAITRCKSSESEYPGRLIVSSFIWLPGVVALKMNISANPRSNKQVSATRFVRDFGQTAPKPVAG
jgi:superfamily I DNA/RNA helicase